MTNHSQKIRGMEEVCQHSFWIDHGQSYCSKCGLVDATPCWAPDDIPRNQPFDSTCTIWKANSQLKTTTSLTSNQSRTERLIQLQFKKLAQPHTQAKIINQALDNYEHFNTNARGRHRRSLMLAVLCQTAEDDFNVIIPVSQQVLDSYMIDEAHFKEAQRELSKYKLLHSPSLVAATSNRLKKWLPLIAQRYKMPKHLWPEVEIIYELANQSNLLEYHSPLASIIGTIYLLASLYQLDPPVYEDLISHSTIRKVANHLLTNLFVV